MVPGCREWQPGDFVEAKTMFNGFPKDAISFLTELRLNNRQDFYQANLERYEQVLKQPLRALCEETEPVVHLIDPRLDTRPGSVMSRLRRDTRFTKDKSPFRDHVWLGWRYPGERRSEGFHMYWGFGPDWFGWGCGSYGPDKPLMDALRQTIRRDPDAVRNTLAPLLNAGYRVSGESFRRMSIPEEVPEDLKGLYAMKYFAAEADAAPRDWDCLFSHEAAEQLTCELERMAPILQLMSSLRGVQAEEPEAAQAVKPEAPAPIVRAVRSAEEFEF